MSGSFQSNCSANSKPIVFFPSIRYGSFSVETSNQSICVKPSPTIRPQSLINPLTRQTFAPWRAISRTLTSGVSSGQNTNASIPARLLYAASAAPALPFVGIAIRFIPSSLAILTAKESPRALNEPVGKRPSSFTRTRSSPADRRLFLNGMSGVIISPRETIFVLLLTGKNSLYRQRSYSRDFSICLVRAIDRAAMS